MDFNHSQKFHKICRLAVFAILILTAVPLATLAFQPAITTPESTQSTEQTTPSVSPSLPYVLINDTASWLESDKPIYDSFTVQERKEGGHPTALPESPFFYGEKIVYLTFDDGPDEENTPLVLNILQENQVPATFFVVGTQVEKNGLILQRIFNEGHAIGNHSYNHIYKQLYQSAITYTDQLHRTDNLIKQVLGVRPRISRAPGGSAGSFNQTYWNKLKEEGYIEVGWNISSGDASLAKAPQIVGNIVRQMQNKALQSHAIVLMHDGGGHRETVKALPEIIQLFKSQGYQFRVVNHKTPPAW